MILETMTIPNLAEMLKPQMHLPAWPGLNDPRAKAKAKQWAKRLGIWERLTEKPISVVRRSHYRDYRRTGSRTLGEAALRGGAQTTEQAALALWLGHPAADLDYVQDLLWAWCETSSWVWPAHEGRTIDLGSSHIARLLAEVLWMLDGQLEDEVKQRVGAEIERRALDALHDWRRPDGWWTVTMNWNHVCNANLITAALYRIRDVGQLAAFIHPLIQRLDYAIQGFAADGGCLEGPSYWNYGFGHFLDAAVVLHHRTAGKLDLVARPSGAEEVRHGVAGYGAGHEHIERICRYPLAAHIQGPLRSTFADSSNGYITAESALEINRFLRIPELYEVAARDAKGRLAVSGWRGLLLYNGERVTGKPDRRDYLLPDLGMVKLRAGGTTLLVLAGRNDVPHNHNDIGSFILHKHGKCLLTDPGAPKYTAKTFGPKRYEILFCRSRGHSVPLINGQEQPPGGQYRGTLAVEGLNQAGGEKRATVDMSHAYGDNSLERLLRRLTLAPDGTVELCDEYAFSRVPRSVEEAFITFEPVRVVRGRRAAVVGKGRQALTLTSAGAAGRFAAERLTEESHEGRENAVVTRITFAPARLAREMTLAFRLR